MSIEDGRSTDAATDAGNIVADAIAEAATRATRYAREVAERRVFPTPDVVAALDQLDGPMPAHGSAASDVLRLLDEVASPATVACTAGRYFGFVIGGAVPAAAAASVLNAAWDQNAAMRATSPAAVRLEEVALGWARDLLGLPHEARGALVTCTTVANVAALAAARHALLARHGWDVEAHGLFGAPEDGTCWCGGTVWHGRQAMRISVCSWATTARDVELSADAIIRLAGQAPA